MTKQTQQMEKEEVFFVDAEIVAVSYNPAHLKPGMYFLSRVSVGVIEPEFNYFKLEEVPENEEMFLALYGAPVRLFLIEADSDSPLGSIKEIGWVYDEETDVYIKFKESDVNHLLNEFTGRIRIICDEEGSLLYRDSKLVIAYPQDDEDDETED